MLVERTPNAKSLIVDLFVSSRGVEETPQSHGQRHLLEHLVALGAKGDLDRRLETAGGFLRARTLRDSISFEMNLPPTGMKDAISALRDLVSEHGFTEAEIAHEADIMEQERALRDAAAQASSEAWGRAFGDRGLDPFGDLDTIRATKPAILEAVRKRAFSAGNLAVVVSGNVDIDAATKAVADALAFLPVAKVSNPAPLAAADAKSIAFGTSPGEFRAVSVPGYRSPDTAATLAAALALATVAEGLEVIYTPSGNRGLVLIGSPTGDLSAINDAQAASLFDLGRILAARWVRNRLYEPETAAAFRGMLLVCERDLKPEIMLENLDSLQFAEFERAFNGFTGRASRPRALAVKR
ncbi:peptidase, M16 family [Fimbriimonas ginsengisoli Gsoil 348]|uniref:Peptidase, M16 family n=1 Tax=Fimbriimonas ginsengisoli Gsoil 348 TaxID=661478 RepID=A0A068NYW6_FIMGI|nr:peptidase, M16 family [Fimbriimonas ginsengisoli Gsoil 348]